VGLLAAASLSLFIAGNAWADAATKAATASSEVLIIQGPTSGTFTTPFSDILSTSIKVPQGFNDLLITVSADTGLITNSTLTFFSSSSLQDVGIDVRVLVDGNPITLVPFVMWDDQFRFRLMLAGERTGDFLTLLGARAFTFTQPNVGPGDHLVEVQARYRFQNIDSRFASSSTQAIVGPRTLVVEGVNLKFIAGNAWADAATKAATASSEVLIVQGTGGTFTTPFSDILSTSIKVPQGFNDLLITVSADTGLITNSSFANTIQDVGIDFRVLVDGNPIITPAPFVMWDDRLRFRRSLISGFVEDDLTLLGVRAFTFTQPNVGPGDHLVEVQARYTFLNINPPFASSSTQAIVGPRTLVVEGVNLK
jgi:hypothetical protein